MSWHTDRTPTTVHVTPVQPRRLLFKSSKPFTWPSIFLPLAIKNCSLYKSLHLLLTDILTVAQIALFPDPCHSSLALLIDWFGFYIIQEYETSIFCNMYYNRLLIYMVVLFPGPTHRKSLGMRLGIWLNTQVSWDKTTWKCRIWSYTVVPQNVQDCVYSDTNTWHRNNVLFFYIHT